MNKALISFLLNLDYCKSKIIKETKQFYIVKYYFENNTHCIVKVKKNYFFNSWVLVDLKLRLIFDKYEKGYKHGML